MYELGNCDYFISFKDNELVETKSNSFKEKLDVSPLKFSSIKVKPHK